jgi:hypothetical protein
MLAVSRRKSWGESARLFEKKSRRLLGIDSTEWELERFTLRIIFDYVIS